MFSHFRRHLGRKAFPPGIKQLLSQRKGILDNFFSLEVLEFEVSENGSSSMAARPFYYCSDIAGLIEFLVLSWNCEETDWSNNVGFDGGKSILKMIWTLNLEEPNSSNGFKYNGARRSIIIGAAPVPETYVNCEFFFKMIQLNNISYQVCSDLKLINIIFGLQTHSASYPCPYALCFKLPDGTWQQGRDRSVASMEEEANKYLRSGTVRNQLKRFHNEEHTPLVTPEDKNMAVACLAPVPPLHTCKLGPVNHLWDFLSKACPSECAEFTSKFHLIKDSYHGGQFEGNECNVILRNADTLLDLLPTAYKPFALTLKALFKVNVAVCGMTLRPDFKEVINDFSRKWRFLNVKFGLTIPNKVCRFEFCFLLISEK